MRTLRALVRRNSEDHRAVELAPWVNHDLRRVVRSGLSALRVPHNVCEAIPAHRPPVIFGTYDPGICRRPPARSRQLSRPAAAGGVQTPSSRRRLRCSEGDLVSFPPYTFPSYFFIIARALGGCQAYDLDPPFPLPLVIPKTSPPPTEDAVVVGRSVVVPPLMSKVGKLGGSPVLALGHEFLVHRAEPVGLLEHSMLCFVPKERAPPGKFCLCPGH